MPKVCRMIDQALVALTSRVPQPWVGWLKLTMSAITSNQDFKNVGTPAGHLDLYDLFRYCLWTAVTCTIRSGIACLGRLAKVEKDCTQ